MKILINCGPGIGDVVQYLYLAKWLKETKNDIIVDFIMSSNKYKFQITREISLCQLFVDNFYYYSKKEPIHNLILLSKLLWKRYDIGILRIDNQFGKNSIWIYKIMRFIRCKNIYSNMKDADVLLPIVPREHFIEKNIKILQTLGLNNEKNRTTTVLNIDNKTIINTDKTIIILSVGTNSLSWRMNGKDYEYDVKSWGYANWIELSKLLTKNNFFVVLMGGKKELNEIKSLNLDYNSDNLLDMIGNTSITESLEILNQCDLVVGSEGGIALGKKVLTIFGGSDYKQWNPGGPDGDIICLEPECYPCFGTERAFLCKDHKCLKNITPKMVFKKITELI